jgi:hypothetical protein
VEEEFWSGRFGGRMAENGEVAIGVEAMNKARARRSGDAEAEGADGNAAIVADFEGGALTPNVRPPRAAWSWPERGTFFLGGEVPGGEWGHAQFAVPFVSIAMEEEVLQQSIGGGQVAELLGGKERGQAVLPILVTAFDLALGLGSWGVAKGDVVEMEGRAELGEGIWDGGEENGVVVDIEFQGEAMGEKSGWEKVEIGEEVFAGIEASADAEAAAIVEHIEQGKEL